MSEPTKEALERLGELFCEAFPTNHPAMHDYALVAMEVKRLREELRTAREDSARIDWLDAQGAFKFEGWRPGAVSIRAVIDAGRAASKGGDTPKPSRDELTLRQKIGIDPVEEGSE